MIPEPANTTVVFLSLFRTDNAYSSISLSMAKELAKNRQVLYFNHPYSLKDCLSGLIKGDSALRRRLPKLLIGKTVYEQISSIPKNFLAVQLPITLPINWLPPGKLYDYLQRFNNRLALRCIQKVLKAQKTNNYLYINCYDPFFAGYLPKKLGATHCIYHCIDDISQNDYTARHGLKLENETCANADLTLVTSTNLYRLKEPHAKRISTFFNAAEVSLFQQVLTERFDRPTELSGIKNRIIGFIGNLDAQRIDYALLKQVALAFPQDTLLLIGPVNSPEPASIGLDKLPNVLFTGSRKLEELPAYLQDMDCVLIPFLCNTLTASIYPLKINEYLAAGKSVVSTSFSTDIRNFAPVIRLAESHPEFIEQIEEALQENDPDLMQKRLEIAKSNTWEARIQQLWTLVADLD
ncbi:MAG: glycosyltransferase [Saprospiraceae bacterium]